MSSIASSWIWPSFSGGLIHVISHSQETCQYLDMLIDKLHKNSRLIRHSLAFALVFLTMTSLARAQEEISGKELFKMHCQMCHGTEGKGDGPASQVLEPKPRDLTKRPYKQGCGPGAIVHTLHSGVKGSAMPSFEGTISDDDMWKLARYVRSLQQGCCQD